MKPFNRKLYFHIGSPKAASTFMQRHIFPKAEGFRYVGKIFGLGTELKPVFNFINDLYFAEDRMLGGRFTEFSKFLYELEIEKFGNIDKDKPLLISIETFVAIAVRPFKMSSSFYTGDLPRALSRLALFAREHDFDLHVIFIQRNFRDFIFSMYAQTYYRYRTLFPSRNLEIFLKSEAEAGNYQTGLFWLYDDNMAKLLGRFFERSNIQLYSFEALMFEEHSTDRKRMEEWLGVCLGGMVKNRENVREINLHSKVATLVESNHRKKSLLQSLVLACDCFITNLKPYEKLKTVVNWTEKCDPLLEKLEMHFADLSRETFREDNHDFN